MEQSDYENTLENHPFQLSPFQLVQHKYQKNYKVISAKRHSPFTPTSSYIKKTKKENCIHTWEMANNRHISKRGTENPIQKIRPSTTDLSILLSPPLTFIRKLSRHDRYENN